MCYYTCSRTRYQASKITGTVKLSDQQYAIMQVLWDKGWAHTTIGTVLSRLEKKDILASETVGRERKYRPLIQEDDVKRSMVSNLISALFKGDPKQLLAHLLKEGEIDKNVLKDIGDLLDKDK